MAVTRDDLGRAAWKRGIEGQLITIRHFGIRCISCLIFSEQNPGHLEDLFHSLDIWHKSCKLTAKLSAVSITNIYLKLMYVKVFLIRMWFVLRQMSFEMEIFQHGCICTIILLRASNM